MNYRTTASIGLFFLIYATSATAFTCSDINPKNGRAILAIWDQNHKLTEGRDVITTTEQYRMCKPNEANEYQITRVVNGQYGKFGLLNCTIIRADEKVEKCKSDLIHTYTDGVIIDYPSMQVGDALNIRYQEDIKFPKEGTAWSPEDIYLEGQMPIEKQRLAVDVPSGINFRYIATKSQPIIEDLGEKKTYTWAVDNVPYYEKEDMMPPARYSLDRVSFTTFGSWDEVEEWFEDLFTEVIKTQYVQDLVSNITTKDMSEKAKVERLYSYVRENITYENYGLTFLSGYKPAELKQTLIRESGDCKGQTALLATMLKQAGIKAYPVILTYRDVEKDVPGPFAFFHSVVYVPEVDNGMWLDTTCTYCPPGHIPTTVQGINALVLFDDRRGFTKTMELPPEKASYLYASEDSEIDGNGSENGAIRMVIVGDAPYAIAKSMKTQGVSSPRGSHERDHGDEIDSQVRRRNHKEYEDKPQRLENGNGIRLHMREGGIEVRQQAHLRDRK
ncbi:MAG: transglutaminase-like domain-containing protein [Candidatus Altiarchaeota archaeon]